MKKNPTWTPVAAVALIDPAGRVLLQQRRFGGRHGGLWEFPGGKVEEGETPDQALVREVREELGIGLGALRPAAFSSDPEQDPERREPHVILLYTCREWRGEPQCLDGEAIAWFAADALGDVAMPPLDRPLARALPGLLAVPG